MTSIIVTPCIVTRSRVVFLSLFYMTRCTVTTATCVFRSSPRSRLDSTPLRPAGSAGEACSPYVVRADVQTPCVARRVRSRRRRRTPSRVSTGIDQHVPMLVGKLTVFAVVAFVEDPVAPVDSCLSRAQLVKAVVIQFYDGCAPAPDPRAQYRALPSRAIAGMVVGSLCSVRGLGL